MRSKGSADGTLEQSFGRLKSKPERKTKEGHSGGRNCKIKVQRRRLDIQKEYPERIFLETQASTDAISRSGLPENGVKQKVANLSPDQLFYLWMPCSRPPPSGGVRSSPPPTQGTCCRRGRSHHTLAHTYAGFLCSKCTHDTVTEPGVFDANPHVDVKDIHATSSSCPGTSNARCGVSTDSSVHSQVLPDSSREEPVSFEPSTPLGAVTGRARRGVGNPMTS